MTATTSQQSRISGRLYFHSTSKEEGIQNVEVTLILPNGHTEKLLTNEYGDFEWCSARSDVPPCMGIEGTVTVKLPLNIPAETNRPRLRLSNPSFASFEVDLEEQPIELSPIRYERQEQAMVRGVVEFQPNDDHRIPLRGVELQLVNTATSEIFKTKTDAQGRYLFDNLKIETRSDDKNGNDQVLADTLPGDPTHGETAIEPQIVYRLQLPPTLDASQYGVGEGWIFLERNVSNLLLKKKQERQRDFVYRVSQGAVRGMVFLDKDGNQHRFGNEPGIKGVPIVLVKTDKSKSLTTQTNNCGEYEFSSVDPGEYTLKFTSKFQDQGRDYILTTSVTQPVTVKAGQTTEAKATGYQIEIHGVAGTVCYEDGTPIEGLVVTLADETGKDLATTLTDAKGEYIFMDRRGKFIVKFPATPFQGQLLSPQQQTVTVNSIARVDAKYRYSHGGGNGAVSRGGLQESLADIASYIPTAQSGMPFAGGSSMAMGGTPSLQRIIDDALASVLGRRLKADDPKAFVLSLNQAFTVEEVNGKNEIKWTPRTYAVQTELGGKLSGAQASIYHRAKSAIDDVLPLLDGLTPLLPNFKEPEANAARSIMRTELVELVNELGIEGGPRTQRVNHIFELLKLQLDRVEEFFGLVPERVITVEEEQNLTNFLVIRDQVTSLKNAWTEFRNQFSGAKSPFLGTQLVLLSRTLSVVAESVEEAYRAMDDVALGPAERQTVLIEFPDRIQVGGQNQPILPGQPKPVPMFVEELLSWITRFASEEAPTLIQDGGKRGVTAIQPIAFQLYRLVLGATQANVSHVGFSRTRVRRALLELALQLQEVERLAGQLSQRKEER